MGRIREEIIRNKKTNSIYCCFCKCPSWSYHMSFFYLSWLLEVVRQRMKLSSTALKGLFPEKCQEQCSLQHVFNSTICDLTNPQTYGFGDQLDFKSTLLLLCSPLLQLFILINGSKSAMSHRQLYLVYMIGMCCN